jgi:hypothetical protein
MLSEDLAHAIGKRASGTRAGWSTGRDTPLLDLLERGGAQHDRPLE